ncbi:crotonase/enoyl-CoA hydratase family protein [soil metagenome]
MTESTLPTYRLDDGIAVITLDDGKANVFSTPALEALEGFLEQVEADAARALVIVGRPGRFSAGFDLAEMTDTVEGMRALVARGGRWWLRLYGLGVPTVAAGTGHALAGGAITLLSCDWRIGADIGCKIGLNEVSIGMPLPIFVVELARDRLTKASFARSTMGGQVYDPAGAKLAGYLDEVVPEDQVVDAALAEARRLGGLRTGAYARTKANARGAMIAACLAGIDADMATVDAPSA